MIPVLDSSIVDFFIAQCDPSRCATIPYQTILPDSLKAFYNPFNAFTTAPAEGRASLSKPILSLDPPLLPLGDSDEKRLFNHYANYVSVIMMPFDHPLNPWHTQYTTIALHSRSVEQKALYHAVLSHAAYNMIELGLEKEGLLPLTAKHSNIAISLLRQSLKGDIYDLGTIMAVIITLLMIEVSKI